MGRSLAHRGPDGSGTWMSARAGLAHQRLAIIDLSEDGRQPFVSSDGNLVLVCNGEIYNHGELRRTLERRGHRFRGRSDNEVILHLYEDQGSRCVDELVGQFAFAIWDEERGRLFCARDRIGEKPLFFAHDGARFAFASEPKALLHLWWVDRTIDHEAVVCMLAYQTTPAPLTFFRGIRALPPASTLLWDRGHLRIDRYWKLNFGSRRRWRWDEALDRYEELMVQSVEGSLVADVPIAVMLSGGVDSSTIAMMAARKQPDIATFCLGYQDGTGPDPEIERAAAVARRLKTQHRVVQFGLGQLQTLPRLIAQYDEPINVSSVIYIHQLMEAMSHYGKVVIGGNAADELFGGYSGYNQVRVQSALFPVARLIPNPAMALLPRTARDRARALREDGSHPLGERRANAINRGAVRFGKRLLSEPLRDCVRDYDPGRHVRQYARECMPRSYLDTVRYSDLMVYHQHGHARIPDVSGMAHGLEIRSPFLDHRVVEFAATLDESLTTASRRSDRRNKAIMRRYLAEKLDPAVAYAPKLGFGFNIDIGALLAGPWRPAITSLLRSGVLAELGVVSGEGVDEALANLPNSHFSVWLLLVLAVWCEIYVANRQADDVASELRLPTNL